MYKTVLIPLDGSELAQCVLPHLEALVAGGRVEKVILLQVVEPPPTAFAADYFMGDDLLSRLMPEHTRAAEEYLGRQAAAVRRLGVASVEEVTLQGRPAESIAGYATHHEVDLILMATHGRSGVNRWLLGSVADRVLHTACVPVLLVRAPGCTPQV